MKVSWMVTGIRQDAWANAHRIPVEEEKPELESGYYLHPELYGQPIQKSADRARHAEQMKNMGRSPDRPHCNENVVRATGQHMAQDTEFQRY